MASAAAGEAASGVEVPLMIINPYDENDVMRESLRVESSVSELKQRVYSLHPLHPLPSQQRIIYKGKLCTDEARIGDVIGVPLHTALVDEAWALQPFKFHIMAPQLVQNKINNNNNYNNNNNANNSSAGDSVVAITGEQQQQLRNISEAAQQTLEESKKEEVTTRNSLLGGNVVDAMEMAARRQMMEKHHAAIQQLVQHQQLLASTLSSVLTCCIANPESYPFEKISTAFAAQKQTSEQLTELIAEYQRRLSGGIPVVLATQKQAGASAQEPAELASQFPQDFNLQARPPQLRERRHQPRPAAVQTPPVPQVQTPPQAPAQPARRPRREVIMRAVIVLEIRLILKLLMLVFVLGWDAPTLQFYMLVGGAVVFYFMKTGLLPNPFREDGAPPQNQEQGGAVQAPSVTSAGWIMRRGRVLPRGQGSFLSDAITVLSTFFLSAIPGWRVQPAVVEVTNANQRAGGGEGN